MIEKITVNAGGYLVENQVFLDEIEEDQLMHLIDILQKCEKQYCGIINIVENVAFCERRKRLSKVSELITSLTSRETEVLRLAIDGLSNNDISEKLFISRETVKSHRKKIVSKVGVNKVNDLKHMLFNTTSVQEIIFKNPSKGDVREIW